jgi:23S rRNA pseudouridine1911/1915/1917 synthase
MPTPLEPEVKLFQADVPDIRLDKYLAQINPGLSRSYIQKLIEQQYVLINGSPAKASHKLATGDSIKLTLPPPEPTTLEAEPFPLDIVYEDNDMIVLNKPPGLTVHPSPGNITNTLVNALLAYSPDFAGFGDSLRPGIVHRLDKDTSGLMLIAKNSTVQLNLINQFKNHLVKKGYLALVRGKLSPATGIIEAPIGRNPSDRKRMAVVTRGREAKTSYKVREHIRNFTFLDITIETGRTHQIRVHLSAIGYPVVGDATYGVKSPYLKRQFLHAYRIGFYLPASGNYIEFTNDLPPDLVQALELIRQS